MHQYLQLLRDVYYKGEPRLERNGATVGFFGRTLEFDRVWEKFPILTSKQVHYKGIVAELLGFIRGADSAGEFRSLGTKIWDENANDNAQWLDNPHRTGEDDLGRIYGQVWRENRSYHQVSPRLESYKEHEEALKRRDEQHYFGVGNLGASIEELQPLYDLLFPTWNNMLRRCYDKSSPDFPRYGGRGIFVHPSWWTFSNFVGSVKGLRNWHLKLKFPDSYQIDKDYFSSNCYGPNTSVWSHTVENSTNRRLGTLVVGENGEDTIIGIGPYDIAKAYPSLGLNPVGVSHTVTGRQGDHKGWKFKYVDNPSDRPFKVCVVDQMHEVVAALIDKNDKRRCVLQAWNASELWHSALPPCHMFAQFSVRGSEKQYLDMTMYQRSCDLPLGVPYNISSYATLMHILGRIAGLKPRKFTHIMGDVHIYKNQMVVVPEQLKRNTHSLPQLQINPRLETLQDFEQAKADDFHLVGYEHSGIQRKMMDIVPVGLACIAKEL